MKNSCHNAPNKPLATKLHPATLGNSGVCGLEKSHSSCDRTIIYMYCKVYTRTVKRRTVHSRLSRFCSCLKRGTRDIRPRRVAHKQATGTTIYHLSLSPALLSRLSYLPWLVPLLSSRGCITQTHRSRTHTQSVSASCARAGR